MEVQLFNTQSSKASIFQSGLIEPAKIMGIEKLQKESNYGEGITVALLDTGCDIIHPNLKDRIVGVRNFTTDNNGDKDNVTDYVRHGTHCAGIICASDIGESGIIGYAPKCNLLVLKVLTGSGGRIEWITNAINYAISQNVDIISMSLGTSSYDENMHNAIKKAVDRNILCVSASGNNGDGRFETDEINYPSGFNESISVGSVKYSKNGSRFSASNKEIDVVAFGEGFNGRGILSTVPNGLYQEMKGTSMATPQITGLLALLKSYYTKKFGRPLTESEIYSQLIRICVDLGVDYRLQGNGLPYYKTIDIIKASGVKHEFRTTYLPELDKDDINEIATTMVKGNSKYYLQQFRNKVTNDAAYHNYMPHKPDYVLSTAHMVEANIGMCRVRGLN